MTSKNFSSKGLLGDSMRRSLWALVLSGVGFSWPCCCLR